MKNVNVSVPISEIAEAGCLEVQFVPGLFVSYPITVRAATSFSSEHTEFSITHWDEQSHTQVHNQDICHRTVQQLGVMILLVVAASGRRFSFRSLDREVRQALRVIPKCCDCLHVLDNICVASSPSKINRTLSDEVLRQRVGSVVNKILDHRQRRMQARIEQRIASVIVSLVRM